MSYILNALRKSEQERQASRPETLTEQVLIPPPPKRRKTVMVIGVLLVVNVLALLVLAWYLKKPDDAPSAKPQADAQAVQQKTAPKPLPAAVKPADAETASGQDAKTVSPAAAPVTEMATSPAPVAAAPAVKTPSIAELAAAKQAAEVKEPKQPTSHKPERGVQTASSPAATRAREQVREEGQAREPRSALAAGNAGDAGLDGDANEDGKNAAPQSRQEIPLFKDLPYDFRSSAPKMAINVFMYTDKPEDRFVVLNMTKYKAGQTTKDAVEIKEIRPDGIIASYGGKVFRIERP
jgi:general secretion pathway protein B